MRELISTKMQSDNSTSGLTLSHFVRVLLCSIAVALALIPPLVALNYIRLYGVNTIILDDYSFVAMFDKLAHRTLCLADLTKSHNEHRFFFGRLLMLALGVPTRLSSVAQMYASWAMILASGIILVRMFTRALGNGVRTLLLFVPVSFLMFNLRAYEVFLFGILLTNSMMICFLLLSIYENYCLPASRHPWLRFTGSLASAVVATFAGSAAGLAVWPIGLLQLGVRLRDSDGSEHSRLKVMIGLWLACSALSGFLYFYQLPISHALQVSDQPGQYFSRIAAYALTLFGSPLCADVKLMQIVGGGVILLYAFVLLLCSKNIWLQRRQAGLLPAVCIVLFALLTNLLIIYGRAGAFETVQATSPRYAQFAYVGLIGLYLAILCSQGMRRWLRNTCLVLVLGLALSAVTAGYANAHPIGFVLRDIHKKSGYYLHTYRWQSDDTMRELFPPDPGVARAVGSILENLRLNVFAEKEVDDSGLPSFPGRVLCAIDTADATNLRDRSPTVTVVRDVNRKLSLAGWVFDANSARNARKATLLLDGSREWPVCYGLHRPDVAQAYHLERLADCGFIATCSTAVLPPGRHDLALRIVSSDGTCVSVSPSVLSIDVQ